MEYIKVSDIYTNSKNFYPQTDIEDKKKQILAMGLLENLVVVKEPNELMQNYRLISGERRWRALVELASEGHDEFSEVPCTVKEVGSDDDEILQIIISNTSRDKDLLTTLVEEKTLLDTLKRKKAEGKTINGYDLSTGRLREVAASMLSISTSKAAQIEAINNNIDEDYFKVLREENNGLTFTYLYALSSIGKEKQREYLAKWQATGVWNKIVEKEKKPAAEKNNNDGNENKTDDVPAIMKTETWELAKTLGPVGYHDNENDAVDDIENVEAELPFINGNESGKLSICYKCRQYEECSDKSSGVESCDRYEKRLSMQKTTEQLYNEEQNRIDKETARKLQEMKDMAAGAATEPVLDREADVSVDDEDNLIKVTTSAFALIASGRKPYIILKGTKYRVNDIIEIAEFKAGELLEGRIRARITCTDTSSTTAAIIDGYVVAGLDILQKTDSKEII